MADLSEIAKESGHFYYPDGRTAYTIIGKNGVERPTTVRDCRTLGLYPSVTEILKMLPKPGLIVWQKRQVLEAALTLTRLPDETDDVFIARIMADADDQARIAREKGQAIHGAIERHVCGQVISIENAALYVRPAMTALSAHLKDEYLLPKCEAEKSFANTELDYGGKVDLHSRELDIVVDFKCKEFSDDTKRLTWDEHKIQLEAYRVGLGMRSARRINVFISTSVPGLVRVIEHDEADAELSWQTFLMCRNLWKLTKLKEVI